MISHSEAGVGGRNAGGLRTAQRTEGTAVFVGRASFRMIPSGQAPDSGRADDANRAGDEPSLKLTDSVRRSAKPISGSEWFESAWFESAEDRVVLAAAATDEQAQLTPGPFVERVASADSDIPRAQAVIETERITAGHSEAAIVGETRRPRVAGLPAWALAAALVVGATATLSAQAFLRPPKAILLTVQPAPIVVAGPRSVPVTIPMMAPTVVPSSIVVPPESDSASPRPETLQRLVAIRTKVRHVRSARATVAPRAIAVRRTVVTARPNDAAVWIDPFAVGTEPTTVAPQKTRAATSNRSPETHATKAATAATTTWVDPFAN
jgi:hypothetical protein